MGIFDGVTEEDKHLFAGLIGSLYREPDLIISDDEGTPYLYRWWLIPRNERGNVYAHLQVASDPSRPLHDHPWDNESTILSGGYTERLNHFPGSIASHVRDYPRKLHDHIQRKAGWAHRLILPLGIPYTMTLFTTGPKVREWGFWHENEWHPHEEWCKFDNGTSLWLGPKVEEDYGPRTF